MSKILELRNKRNTLWEQTKAFLEENRDANGLVKADAVEQYNRMAADVKALGDEITRLEEQAEMDAKLAAPTSTLVHSDPKDGKKKNVRPTATAEYSEAFWNMLRGRISNEALEGLSIGEDEKGGEEGSTMEIEDLEIFENVAYIMAFHADPTIPKTIDEWLEQFDMFSIYEVLPEILELWGTNLITDVEAKKNQRKAAGK